MQNKETWKNRNPVTPSGSSGHPLLPLTVMKTSSLLKRGSALMDIKGQASENKSLIIYLFLHIVFIIILISFYF